MIMLSDPSCDGFSKRVTHFENRFGPHLRDDAARDRGLS